MVRPSNAPTLSVSRKFFLFAPTLFCCALLFSRLRVGVRPELCVIGDRSSNLLFCLEVSIRFVIGAQPAHHGRIPIEPTIMGPVLGSGVSYS